VESLRERRAAVVAGNRGSIASWLVWEEALARGSFVG